MSTDITQLLFAKAAKIPIDKVIKSPHFNLFEGTNALEIGNAKLDTGSITLTGEELHFDCSQVRSLSEVLWISDSLLRSVFTWLDNASLSVTVLSNRYAEELLMNYNTGKDKNLNSCLFYTSESPTENALVDKVLRSVVLGTLAFCNLCAGLAHNGTVYEEEDINPTAMNLDLLSLIDGAEIAREIEWSIEYLKENYEYHEDCDILVQILTILLNFLDLTYFFGIKVANGDKPLAFDIEILKGLLKVCESLRGQLDYLNKLPEIKGCYSMGIQKRLDNRAPIKALVSYKQEDYTSLVTFVKDMISMFEIQHRTEPSDVINYVTNFSNYPHHVLSRAIFPIFLLRDDGSILGSENVKEFLVSEMVGFNCYGSGAFTSENIIIKKKMDEFINGLTMNYLEYLQSFNQNSCRQRQHLLKIVLSFDSLQVSAESLEMEMEQTFLIKDNINQNGHTVPALPLTCWVYYKKLSIMINIIFKGFHLQLYNTWEYLSMYWTVLNLITNQLEILQRIQKHILTKLQAMKNHPQHVTKLRQSLGRVINELAYYRMLNSLTVLQILNLRQLKSMKIITVPEFPFSNEEKSFKFRQKSFKSIGVPPQPTFSDFQQFQGSKEPSFEEFKSQVNELKKSINENITTLLSSRSCNNGINDKQCQDWTNLFKRSMVGICLNGAKEGYNGQEYKVEVMREGFHGFFPVLKCVKK
ncbi:hypothetical protein WICPIJ_008602 [Wickerhamomyces pijperi]|uniref:Uncharacterized protein n=1 Tax=Wickerhamomyces pijperi TaxID=599730 RepID=A0A9P8PXQ6_WICPI|nr:hypothetical protein WICPIJ_008602 [Wickerhamomyces pijperi]